ncbi:MAG: NAD-dependent deacylase [Hymenobacteraceae bacterium]|nr:NAD-dependent deacylase [Hymenobacteraceae bacterium]
MTRTLIVLTGAGISAESGIQTFRDSNGLWENHRVEDVATPEGFRRNPALVLEFYNQRRAQAHTVAPNAAHLALAEFQEVKGWTVHIITQNVDDLHERAGSRRVLHLHGQLNQSRSGKTGQVYPCEGDINEGDTCPAGGLLRPHIVWFGEEVPAIEEAAALTEKADAVLIVGTSLQVYPAAGLLHSASPFAPVYLVDKHVPGGLPRRVQVFEEAASTGVPKALAAIRAAA